MVIRRDGIMTMPSGRLFSAMSRRRVLAATGIGTVGLAAASLIGCSATGGQPSAKSTGTGANAGPTTGAASRPKPGGILKYAEQKNPDSLDSVRSSGGIVSNYTSMVYSRLFTFEPGDGAPASGKVVGDLIQKWEQPDPLTLVLHVNPAAKWDQRDPLNGRNVSSDDVIQSWNRWSKQDTYRTLLASSASKDAAVDTVEAVDASTVRMKFKFADSTAIPLMAEARFWIQPAEGIAGKIDLSKEPRGSGPFLFDNYKPSVSITYKRNPNWFLGGGERPYVDGVTIPIITDQAQIEVQFRSKNVHLAAVSQTNIPQFAKELTGTRVVVGGPVTGSPCMGFSYLPGQPWHDVRVRRAVSMALDRDAMADVLFNPKQFQPLGVNLTTRWNAPISGGYGVFWLDPKSKDFGPAGAYMQRNVAEATKMLAAAGYSSSKPLEFDNIYPGIQWGTDWPQRVEILQSMFKDAGIKMNGVSVDYVTEFTPKYMRAKAQYKGKTTEAAMHFMPGGATPDPLAYYYQRLQSNGASTEVGNKYPELDAMEEKQRAVTNFDDRIKGIHDLNRWSVDNMITLPVGPATEGVDLNWKALHGPDRYRSWGASTPGISANTYLFANYYFDEQI